MRYRQIDALRGVAAFAVLVYHLFPGDHISREWMATSSPDAIGTFILTTVFNGTGATVLFFVISGYVLGHNAPDRPSVRYLASFFVRRFFRIMPGAWASLLFASAIMLMAFGQAADWSDWPRVLTLRRPALAINGPLWSLQVEWVGSVLFPFLLFLSIAGGLAARLALLAVTVYCAQFHAVAWPLAFLPCFQIGIMVRDFTSRLQRGIGPVAANMLLGAGLIAIMLPTNLGRVGALTPWQEIMIATAGSFTIVGLVAAKAPAWLHRFLLRPGPQFLGLISFSLYLLNLWIVRLVSAQFASAFQLESAVIIGLAAGVIAVPLSIGAAWLAFVSIEAPFHRLGQAIGRTIMNGGRPAPAITNAIASASVHR